MANKLITNIETFSLNQKIFLVNGPEVKVIASVPTDRVGETLVGLIYTKDIEEIQINGANTYINKICKEVTENKDYKKVRILKNGEVFN